MKKIIITFVLLLSGVVCSSAQDLLPPFAEKLEEIVTERVKVMELDKGQAKTYREIQKKRLFGIQELRNDFRPGTEEYRAKVKVLNKKYNQEVLALITTEQRMKWAEYAKEKKKKQ